MISLAAGMVVLSAFALLSLELSKFCYDSDSGSIPMLGRTREGSPFVHVASPPACPSRVDKQVKRMALPSFPSLVASLSTFLVSVAVRCGNAAYHIFGFSMTSC